MIKCQNCGEEFSYGRKISCCHSTYFGIIFNGVRIFHKWNCNTLMSIKESNEALEEDFSEVSIIDDQKPTNYNWNCKTPLRLEKQNELIERDYVLIYE